jgi:NADH:ubiquinone reductase (H+-translocating)
MGTPKHIIIVGGGFAGLQLAKSLAKKGLEITLIDKMNHHMFQPLFYQVACGRLEPSNISFPFRKIFQKAKNIKFKLTEVREIRPESKTLLTDEETLSYDQLVIATGCKTNFFGLENIQKNALGMKSTREAIHIRNQILLNFEQLMLGHEAMNPALWTIVIVGGGPTGVELAGAYAEMKKHILPKDYPQMDFSRLKIFLINRGDKILDNMSEISQQKSKQFLQDLGVDIIFNDGVTDYNGQEVSLKSGQKIASSNVIWAAGVTGNVIDGFAENSVQKNRYLVNEFHQLLDHPDVFALGDVACMASESLPMGHPQLANVAIAQAKNLAENLLKPSSEWQAFAYEDVGSMATIGKNKAVVDLPKFKFQGRWAWYVWMFLHLMLILGVRNKFFVFCNWAWNYLSLDSSLRLITSAKKK